MPPCLAQVGRLSAGIEANGYLIQVWSWRKTKDQLHRLRIPDSRDRAEYPKVRIYTDEWLNHNGLR